jgi:hypothetical protein
MAVLLFAVCVSRFASRESGLVVPTPRVSLRRRAKPTFAPMLIVLGFTAVAVLLPLQLKSVGTKNATGLTSLFQYLLAGILGLSARDQFNPDWTPPAADGFLSAGPAPGYGTYTFTGLFRALHGLGMPVEVGANAYEYYTVTIGGVQYSTNTLTSIGDFRLDFGFIGVFVMFFVLSVAATMLQMRQGRNSALYAVPVTAYLLVTLIWSFFGSSLLDDFKYLLSMLFGCYILRRLVGSTYHPPDTSGNRIWDADLPIGVPDLSAGLRAEAAVRGWGVPVPVLAERARDSVMGGVRHDRRRIRRRGAAVGEEEWDPGSPVRQGREQGADRPSIDRGSSAIVRHPSARKPGRSSSGGSAAPTPPST